MQYIYGDAPAPTRVLGGTIWVHDGIVSNWQEIIDTVEDEVIDNPNELVWADATTMDGRKDGPRRNKIMNLTQAGLNRNDVARKIHNQVGALIDECVGKYAKHFDTDFLTHEDYQMLKYSGSTNDHYDAHYDGGPSTKRWISAIIYLNDDYEGGELEFVHFGVKLKPTKGSLVIFPSNYAYSHIAHPVTSGTKYAIVTWIWAN